MEDDVTFDVAGLHADDVGWTAGATVELKVSNSDDPVLYRDYDDKKINDVGENPDWEDAQDDVGSGDDTNTGYSSSYGCDYNAEYDYCTDTGWCSAGSGEFEIGMCGHRWCCCAPDTTTETPIDTGDGGSYGCDYNAEYDYCTDTGWCSAGSGEFEIGMCGHRWCCCAPEGAETSSTPPSTSVTSTNTGYSSSYGCDYNAEYDYCTDTGWCLAGSGEFEIGMCGHRWCCCAP